MFREENLYLISEIKTDDWGITSYPTEDIAITGVINNQCFLIDCFTPLQMKDYVSPELLE